MRVPRRGFFDAARPENGSYLSVHKYLHIVLAGSTGVEFSLLVKENDARKLDHKGLEAMRIHAVKRCKRAKAWRPSRNFSASIIPPFTARFRDFPAAAGMD
jgi:hypothetical protein